MNVLLLNQCFYPDVLATAQQLTDLALELTKEGHQVTVIASDRGYDDPSVRFPRRETWRGINIVRIPTLALGKTARWRRALNFASFIVACSWRLLGSGRFDLVVALTSPPLISVLGALFTRLKGGRFVFWVMDLNPDEAVAAGWLAKDSLTARMLNKLLVYSLKCADQTVVLDRFMKDRVVAKGIPAEKLSVIPPWSLNDAVSYSAAGRQQFRAQHNIDEQFVVMYSGNHSPCHSLDTLLSAAKELADRRKIVFCFVGGGSEFHKVKAFADRHQLKNVVCLGYQPLDQLAGSLSAADLHVVVMGDAFTGIVHPSKIYNIMTIGTPVLYIGPAESHVGDIIQRIENKRTMGSFRHGEVAQVVAFVSDAVANSSMSGGKPPFPTAFGETSSSIAHEFSKERLMPKMIEVLSSSKRNQSDRTDPKTLQDVRSDAVWENQRNLNTEPSAVGRDHARN